MQTPRHPGRILVEDVLPPLGLSLPQAAAVMGLTHQLLYRLRDGRISVSPAMALRLGKLTGMGALVWLNVQAVYDLATLAPKMAGELDTIPTLKALTVSKNRASVSERRQRKSSARINAAGTASGPTG